MKMIFRYKDKEYSYSLVNGKVQNYEISEDPYQGMCDTQEEKDRFDALFETVASND
jgi:hypothetical protein